MARLVSRMRLALVLCGVVAAPAQAQLTVTYIANAGFMIEGGGHKVLIDALFARGIAPYPGIPSSLRSALESGGPPFDDVDVILATHHHADHFDAGVVARHLRANPRTRFVSTPQAVERVVAEEPALADRLEAALPPEGERRVVRRRSLELQVLNLHHGRGHEPPVQNAGFLANMGGLTWIHVGDTEVEESDVQPLRLSGESIDVALLPTWLLTGERGLRVVEGQIRPRAVVVTHRAGDDAPPAYFAPDPDAEALAHRIRARFPGAVIPGEPGESTTFPSRPPDE